MNLLWIVAITIFVCAVMVKGVWVQTEPILHQTLANLFGSFGLV